MSVDTGECGHKACAESDTCLLIGDPIPGLDEKVKDVMERTAEELDKPGDPPND